ncbi:hypothetical protein O6H91_02G082600 [Diphasiastrum complanatum]|uniref:Uncharacterized protein n=1 Tax=Diphasiastrum complanatum TaxID=34168 RepID=A0ACC2EHB6_DIPCM|nr:hypothetical protein O6H91_02G082600 [Diphasiastrum complanatum]
MEARKTAFIFGLLVSLSLLLAASTANAAASCNLFQLASCLPASRKGGPLPSSACCTSIQKISPDCLCQGVQSGLAKMYNVDIPTALTIPKNCGLQALIPSGYSCGGTLLSTLQSSWW